MGAGIQGQSDQTQAEGWRETKGRTALTLEPIVEASESTIRAMNMKKICLLTCRSTAVRLTGAALQRFGTRAISFWLAFK